MHVRIKCLCAEYARAHIIEVRRLSLPNLTNKENTKQNKHIFLVYFIQLSNKLPILHTLSSGDLPYSNNIVRISSKQSLTIS